MSALKLTVSLLLAALFAVGPGLAATGSWNGVAFTAWNGVVVTSWNGTSIAAGGGGGPTAVSDDFNRASLGANWTVEDGGAIIAASTELNFVDGGFAENVVVYSASQTSAGAGYVSFTKRDGDTYPVIVFRFTNSTTAFYALEFDNGSVNWFYRSQIGGSSTQINSSSGTGTFGDNQRIGMTFTGTGSSTVIRIWNLGSLADTPSAPDNWDGDTTPDVTFTDNPASPVDSGGYVGLGAYQASSNQAFMDAFFAGPL